jgi:hypothetical protein
MPDTFRDELSKSEYGFGPLAFAGGSNISAEAAISGVAYKVDCPVCVRAVPGLDADVNKFRDTPGVPGTDDAELADRMLSIRFPPLPELTVICGGRFGAPAEPSIADILFVMKVSFTEGRSYLSRRSCSKDIIR